jgi:hypothetical protein
MKKHLFAWSIIACAIFLASCSLTKRHYTNGYYVAHNAGKSSTAKNKEQITDKKKQQPLYSAQNIYDNSGVDNPKPISLTANEIVAANNKETPAKITPAPAYKKHEGFNVPKIFQAENAKSFQVKKADPDSLASDALSLFWIIILILLILWLVAILTGGWGLGDFVHILLVVALILLILWILRII